MNAIKFVRKLITYTVRPNKLSPWYNTVVFVIQLENNYI